MRGWYLTVDFFADWELAACNKERFLGIYPVGLFKAQDKTFNLESRPNFARTNLDNWFLSEETDVGLTVSPMPVGMEPENWLEEREGIRRVVSCVRFHGIDWLRLFPCRSRICNIFKLKMDGGMLPEKRFCEKFEFSRYTIWVPNVDGMGPEKEFPPVETSSKETTLPSCSSRDPLSWLLSSCKIWSSATLLKFTFMVPQKSLPPGPRVWSLLQLLRFHGIVPESWFWFHVKSWSFDEPLSSDGNSLVKKFCWSARVVRRERFPTPGGMVPMTRFLDRSRMRSLLRLPIWTGMLPVRLLDAECRTFGYWRAPDPVTISAGMGSEKSFWYK